MKAKILLGLSAVLFSINAFAGALSSQTTINRYTAGIQNVISSSAGGNGDQLILWRDYGRNGSVFMNRYDANGVSLQSGEVQVGDNTTDAAIGRDGRYVLVRTASDGSNNGVFASVYNRNGQRIVNEFRVHTDTWGEQAQPVVAMDSAGNFAVAWSSSTISTNPAVKVKAFYANGYPLSNEMGASNDSAATNVVTDITFDDAGKMAINWYAIVPRLNQAENMIRKLTINGTQVGTVMRVNTTVAGLQLLGKIAMNRDGQLVSVWQSGGQDGSGYGVYGQLFDTNMNRVGGEFRVNTTTAQDQNLADVGINDKGQFAVVWESTERLNGVRTKSQVFLRQYNADGTATATDEAMVSMNNALAMYPRMAMDYFGKFNVYWNEGPENNTDIVMRRFALDNLPSIQTVQNAQPTLPFDATTGEWRYFKLTVPVGHATIRATINGSIGNPDVFMRYQALPSSSRWDGKSDQAGSNEAVIVNGIPSGDWYIGIYSAESFSAQTLLVESY